MSTLKKLLIAALILITIGVVGSVLTFKSLIDTRSLVEKETIIEDTYENIQVNTNNMAIELYESSSKETKLVTKLSEDVDTEISVSNGTLNIDLYDERAGQFVIPDLNFFDKVPTVVIYLPEKIYKNVHVNSDNGMIEIARLQAEELSVKTVNGLVELNSITAEKTEVITVNGLISLENIRGKIKAQSTNGMISYDSQNIEQDIDFKTVNGVIEINTNERPGNVTFQSSVEVGSLDIFGSNEKEIVYGSGEYLIKLRTSVGSVTVD